MTNFFKSIFIWWQKQTIGTFIYTLFFGKFVGRDEFDNNSDLNKSKPNQSVPKTGSKISPQTQ